MSPTLILERLGQSGKPQLVYLRSHRCYPITLELQYKFLKENGPGLRGLGRTLNMSSSTVLFEATEPLESTLSFPEISTIELALDWPILLNDVCRMRLKIRGRFIRQGDRRFAVLIEHHEFRTVGVSPRQTRADVLQQEVKAQTAS